MKKILILFIFLFNIINSFSETYVINIETGTNKSMLYSTIILNNINFHNCMLDTGCQGIYLTYEDFILLKNKKIITDADYIGDINTLTAENKRIRNKQYKIKNFQIGNCILHNVIVTFDIANKTGSMRLIGLRVFKMFKSINFDFINNKLYLIK